MNIANLFHSVPAKAANEVAQVLAESSYVRIERIVSNGQSSDADSWYDQDEHEWVIVLKGEARLQFECEAETLHMKPGDFVNIPAHCKHRVDWTTPSEPTVWLAVFYRSDQRTTECSLSVD